MVANKGGISTAIDLGTAASGPYRETSEGVVQGFVGAQGGHVWLGIPYASPPVGSGRWRAPRPAARRDFVLQATRPGNCACQDIPAYQRSTSGDLYIGAEDCLYLNIWSPPLAPVDIERQVARLPVMVWIHGGANVHGRGDTFDGEVLATAQDVIVVTINYRLGVFGWFRHAALRAETAGEAERSGNFAVLDMLAALSWVRDNIAFFGGDPGRVTIFGESAGGTNVFALLVSPLAKGLFQRAIVQSGMTATMTVEEAEHCVDDAVPGNARSSSELLLRLLLDDRLANDRADAKRRVAAMAPAEIARYLRGKSFAELDAAYGRIADRAALQTFPQLFRDGVVLSQLDVEAALQDAEGHACVPVMIGSTRDEFSLLLPFISGSLLVDNGPDGAVIRDRQRYALVAEYLSLLLKAHAVDRPAEIFSLQRRQPVFVYRFDWDELAPVFWLDDIAAGATHGLDVPFVFGHARLGAEFFQLRLLDADSASFLELSRQMMSYWAEFARTGDPGCGRDGELPRWLPWQSSMGGRHSLLLDAKRRGGIRLCGERLTTASVLAALQRDVRMSSPCERHRLLCDLQRTGGSFGLFGREDVAALTEQLRQECTAAG